MEYVKTNQTSSLMLEYSKAKKDRLGKNIMLFINDAFTVDSYIPGVYFVYFTLNFSAN